MSYESEQHKQDVSRNGWHVREVYFQDGEPTMHREPPKRKWVGLTDEQIKELYSDDDNFRMTNEYVVAFARAIEAKLREKNT